jgi:putative transposase
LYLQLHKNKEERLVAYKNLCSYGLAKEQLLEIRDNTNKNLAFGSQRFKLEIEKLTGRRMEAGKRGRPKAT